jgi:CHAT domain-containing protein
MPSSTRVAIVEYYVLAGETAAFVVRADCDEPMLERLDVPRAMVKEAAHRLVDEFSPDNINPVHPEWSSDLEYLEPLARGLLDPVWPYLADVDVLCIVPHGYLFYLPFHAMKLASGRHLVEERPIVYAPSAALAINARRHRRPNGRRFVGFGTGMPDDPPARRDGFEQEVMAVSAMPVWKEREPLTGNAAAMRMFAAKAAHADVVHCACHGYFDAADPLRSGLVLADGQLSARQMASTPLTADLVYLSACVSGRHDIQPGDEILGVVRGLISAGAASIVASLWPIAAWSSTRLLMETFYTRWLSDGMPKALALQAAQVETAREYRHPYHWAPFTLLGDWH